jgi:hypothetical protein
MGGFCPPLFGNGSQKEIEAELAVVRHKIAEAEVNLDKLKEEEKELAEALRNVKCEH